MTDQKEASARLWFLYVLRTRTGILYTGISIDVTRRILEHESGQGAKSLRGKGPLTLEYSIEVGNRSRAQRLEAAVKKLTRAQKEALIAQDLPLPEID